MHIMTKTTIFIFFLGLCPLFLFSQTSSQLELGVRLYNTLRDSATTEGAKVPSLIKMADESEILLKKVVLNGTPEEVNAAKYFIAVLTLVRAESYYRGTRSEQDLVLPTLKSVEGEFDRLVPSAFPIRYSYFGKSYKIEYTDFEYSRMKFYAELSEMYVGKDVVNMRKYARKSLEVTTLEEPYLRYILYYFLNNAAETPAEKIECAQKLIFLYPKINAENRKLLDGQINGLVYLKKYAPILLDARYTDWDKSGDLSVARSKDLAAIGGLDSLACRFFDQAVAKGAPSSIAEKQELLDFYVKAGFKSSGIKLCDKMLAAQSTTNCDGYDLLARYYSALGENLKAKSMTQSAEKCRKNIQDQADAEARRREKAQRRANRNKVYLGAYVLRIVQRPQYIDFGGTLDIPAGKYTRLEFSYMKARNDQDYLLMERLGNKEGVDDIDNPHWDGFYGHFGIKWMEHSYHKSKSYYGILFNYNQRDYQPQTSIVTPTGGILPSQQEVVFAPRMTTYGMMLNFGSMALGKPFGVDMYMGVGPTFSQFSLNNETYTKANYDFSNPFLQERKEQFWGFQIRMGLTVGLSL
jgi:hypothetical protein